MFKAALALAAVIVASPVLAGNINILGSRPIITPHVNVPTQIGSQSTGAGAGKVTFNPFSITRKIDLATPVFR